jgi:hypothetical protein
VRDARFDESRKQRPDMDYWKNMALPTPEPTILTEEEQLNVLREDIDIPVESANQNTEEDRQGDPQKAILLEEDDDDTHQGGRGPEECDKPQRVATPRTPEPDERGHIPVDQDLSTETLPGSFPTEEPLKLPPSPPEEQNTTESGPATAQLDQQTISQTEDQNICEDEDQPAEPNPPHEDLTEEGQPHPTLSEANGSYTQSSIREETMGSTSLVSWKEAEEEDRGQIVITKLTRRPYQLSKTIRQSYYACFPQRYTQRSRFNATDTIYHLYLMDREI